MHETKFWDKAPIDAIVSMYQCALRQWRRQDLLRGGAKIEIMSSGTHGGLRGRVQQLLDD